MKACDPESRAFSGTALMVLWHDGEIVHRLPDLSDDFF